TRPAIPQGDTAGEGSPGSPRRPSGEVEDVCRRLRIHRRGTDRRDGGSFHSTVLGTRHFLSARSTRPGAASTGGTCPFEAATDHPPRRHTTDIPPRGADPPAPAWRRGCG